VTGINLCRSECSIGSEFCANRLSDPESVEELDNYRLPVKYMCTNIFESHKKFSQCSLWAKV
jgi:hypothetical protein